MKGQIIDQINEVFNIYKFRDVWGRFESFISNIETVLTDSFLDQSAGLMIDQAKEINEIITTTFITDNIFRYIKEKQKTNILIFTHHPFYQETNDYTWNDAIFNNLKIIKDNHISIYVCHMALDFHKQYSTAYYFARELIKNPQEQLKYKYPGVNGEIECEYYGLCTEDFNTKLEIISKRKVYHRINENEPQIVCCSPGGGNILDIIKLASEKGVDTYITGISEFRGRNSIVRNKTYFQELEKIGLNIIGLGHYETESLAMQGLVTDYFNKFNCPSSYFKDKYYE